MRFYDLLKPFGRWMMRQKQRTKPMDPSRRPASSLDSETFYAKMPPGDDTR